MYREKFKKELLPPTTFEEFNRIAQFFTKACNPSSPVSYGATLTLGNTGVALSEFLARFFSYARTLYSSDRKIHFDSLTARRALNDLISLKPYSNPKYNIWWKDTANEFASGDVAMSILYSNFSSDLLNPSSKIIGKIGYTLVPGKNPVIGGGVLGVSKFSSCPEEALAFIKWMCSEPVSSAATLLGSVSACKKTYENYEIVDNFPWLDLAKDSFSLSDGRRTPSPCPFDERQFQHIVGMAVKSSYDGALAPDQALKLAQNEFEKCFIGKAGPTVSD